MNPFALFHLTDGALRRDMFTLSASDHLGTARLIAHIAEFDARRLYAAEGFPSMHAYCVELLHLSDDAAYKRIRAGRAARQHPAIFPAIAGGRLHLSGVVLLTPRLSEENADELVDAATHKTDADVRQGESDLTGPTEAQLFSKPVGAPGFELVSKPVESRAPGSVAVPLAPGRYATQFTIGQITFDVLGRVEQLLGRRVRSQDLDQALAHGLAAIAARLEKRKFAATEKPRAQRRPSRGRHIPAEVRRRVWARDEGRCTFIAAAGRRCEARAHLEFDHIEPVARGGRSTVENLRLRCRAHNQYEAERAFGAGFMRQKRERARQAMASRRAGTGPSETLRVARAAGGGGQPDDPDVTPWLRRLGFGAREAKQAAAHCARMPDAPLEARVRAALSFLSPPVRVGAAARTAALSI